MDIQTATKGMLKTRDALRSTKGVTDPFFISEQMQRLAQYTGRLEEHLAELEERLEVDEMQRFLAYIQDGKSVNQAEILAKQEVGNLKGEIARFKRYINSSWSLIGTAQSRWNHLNAEYKSGARAI